jgi:hypothetical protein
VATEKKMKTAEWKKDTENNTKRQLLNGSKEMPLRKREKEKSQKKTLKIR